MTLLGVTVKEERPARDAVQVLVDTRPPTRQIALGGDKNYDLTAAVSNLVRMRFYDWVGGASVSCNPGFQQPARYCSGADRAL